MALFHQLCDLFIIVWWLYRIYCVFSDLIKFELKFYEILWNLDKILAKKGSWYPGRRPSMSVCTSGSRGFCGVQLLDRTGVCTNKHCQESSELAQKCLTRFHDFSTFRTEFLKIYNFYLFSIYCQLFLWYLSFTFNYYYCIYH